MGSHVPRLASLFCIQTVKGSIPFDSTQVRTETKSKKLRRVENMLLKIHDLKSVKWREKAILDIAIGL